MTLSRRVASLLTGLLLLAAGGHAQTPLGQPTLEERKVQIWCATAKFVYEDTGHPELKSQLKCGGPLKDFAGSIKADEQRVYSALYQPLEVQGVMYKGLGSDNSRLQTLVREIINRLRTSPARKGNAARLAGVTKLETALKNYLDQGTPIGDLPAAEAAAETETVDTTATTDEATAAAPGDAGLDEAGVATPTPAAASGAGESLMNKFFGPLGLILALLSLVLYALMRKSLGEFQKELSARIDKRRDEILALQTTPGSSGKPAERFSPAQLRELEQLIQQRVEQELQKRQAEPKAAAATSGASAARAVPPAAATPVATPAVVPVAPAVAAPAAPVSAPPAAPASVAAPVLASAVAPEAAPAAQNDFESLLPPVQLPPPVVPAADLPRTRYVKVPVNGVFNEYDFSDEPQHDSIYEIHLDPQWPELATFSVTQNPAVHAYAIQSAQYSLREACKYQQPAGPVTRIVTEEEGVLRKAAGAWQIEQKATIRFE